MDDFYVDPTQPDPRFPNRPTHPDFFLLSNVMQGMDLRSGAGASMEEVIEVDGASLVYAIKSRLQVLHQVARQIQIDEDTIAVYVDAFTLGKKFAEAQPR